MQKILNQNFFGNIILALYNSQALVGLFQKPKNEKLILIKTYKKIYQTNFIVFNIIYCFN